MKKITFGIAGNGWRADFYLRIARLYPERFAVSAITSRNEKTRKDLETNWGIKTFESVMKMVNKSEFDFVVTSVPWDANPGVVKFLMENNIPCLS